MKKKSRRKPGHVTHNRYELLLKSEYKGSLLGCFSSVEEVMIISKATNIDISELIGISLPRQSEVPTPITNERLFSVIESQQRTIENLSKK